MGQCGCAGEVGGGLLDEKPPLAPGVALLRGDGVRFRFRAKVYLFLAMDPFLLLPTSPSRFQEHQGPG